MSTHEQNIARLGWDPEDPHGILGQDEHGHGHHVVGWRTQLAVLLALLFFTALTVGFYNAEQWAEGAFNIDLPWWVNVAGAMTIATVKALLVCMFFMQLRYDKALNTFALLFCLFCVALFLGFAMIDLETRDRVTAWKQDEVQSGGTGTALDTPAIDERFDARLSPRVNTGGVSLAEFRRQQKIEEYGSEKAFWKSYYKKYPGHHHSADTKNYYETLGYAHADQLPSADRSFPRSGRTEGLFSPGAPSERPADDDQNSDDEDSDDTGGGSGDGSAPDDG